jgi:two-component system, NtrC family, sensor kinase
MISMTEANPQSEAKLKETLKQYQRAYELQKSAREKAEQLLEEKSRELFLKNESLEDALEKLRQQQAQLVTHEKLASIGQLGAGLAHELNNPNAFIQNNFVTLEDYVTKLSQGLDEAFKLIEKCAAQVASADPSTDTSDASSIAVSQAIEEIRKTSDLEYIREDLPVLIRETLAGTTRIKNIANGLRYFANPDISTRKPLDVNECVRQAQQLIPRQEQAHSIELQLGELPRLTGLPLLMSQALANVIQNAMEAQPDTKTIVVRTFADDEHISIEITDQGVGMSSEIVSQMFKPFYTTKEGHNGLGLSITQSIINQHNGMIDVQSSEHNGTKIKIRLPLQ